MVQYVEQPSCSEKLHKERSSIDDAREEVSISFFCQLKTHLADKGQNLFGIDYILTVKDKLSVKLTQETLERSMKESLSTSANGILSTLNQVFSMKTILTGIDAIGDGKLNQDDLPPFEEGDKSREDDDESKMNTSRQRDILSKGKMNDHILMIHGKGK